VFLILHTSHIGEIGLQMFCPYITKVLFMSSQNFLGIVFLNSISVSSGIFVLTSPSRLEIRCTWVSTGIAGCSNAYTRTQFAVFLPTPGISTSLSMSDGTFPPYLEMSSFATSIIRFDFTW
jgi:hypothetical protein